MADENVKNVYDSENFTVVRKIRDDGEIRFIAYSHSNDVSVYLDQNWRTGKYTASVNWASLGAKSADDARVFLGVLSEAVELTDYLNTKVFN